MPDIALTVADLRDILHGHMIRKDYAGDQYGTDSTVHIEAADDLTALANVLLAATDTHAKPRKGRA